MEGENETEINGCDRTESSNTDANVPAVVIDGESATQAIANSQTAVVKSAADNFYERLGKLYESSGLSVVFNFRETSLDLYLFYKEVTERGGYYQVTKEGRWGEVASLVNLKSNVSMIDIQFQKFYANLLYQFEQMYYYRTPVKPPATSGHSSGTGNSLTGKRKERNSSSQVSTVNPGKGDGPVEKKKCNTNSCQVLTGPGDEEQNFFLQMASENKELKKYLKAPLAPRTGYQMFLREECARLKKINGESSRSVNFRDTATDAWRSLSESDRQPYVEESKKDKERYNREMAIFRKRLYVHCSKTAANTSGNSKADAKKHKMAPQTEGEYHVMLEPDTENFSVVDDSTVEVAFGLMKNARADDPIFEINWDDYCESLGITS